MNEELAIDIDGDGKPDIKIWMRKELWVAVAIIVAIISELVK